MCGSHFVSLQIYVFGLEMSGLNMFSLEDDDYNELFITQQSNFMEIPVMLQLMKIVDLIHFWE